MHLPTSRDKSGIAAIALPALVACCLAAAVFAVPAERDGEVPAPVALNASQILNRSLFLSWDEVPEEGFGCYEVYAGPAAEGLPERPLAVIEEADRCYFRLRGLEPETEYAARIRLVPADGGEGVWSGIVRATTLRDGWPEDAPRDAVAVPTIMYHHVRPRDTFPPGVVFGGWISTENFERDLAWLKECGFHTVTTSDIIDGRLPEKPVFLTFDDGYTDFLDYAVPLLVKYGFTAANAVVTRRTAGLSTWASADEWPLDSMMTWPQIRRCLQAGMEIGGHTQTHVNLFYEPEELGQVRGSFDDLLDALGRPPIYFCYPWGMSGHAFHEGMVAVREAGYLLATSTWPPRRAFLSSDPYFFPRKFANEEDSLEDFALKVNVRIKPGKTGK